MSAQATDEPIGLAGPRPVPPAEPAPAETATGLSSIPDAIAAVARGEMVLVVDDPDRENEGDLVMAAAHATPATINTMVTHGRGLVCEVIKDDGTMARPSDVLEVARTHGLHLVTIEDLVAYRRATETLVDRGPTVALPTRWGPTRAVGDRDHRGIEHVAVCVGDVAGARDVLVRVHSECLTGDVSASRRCDCGEQLDASMRAMHRAGRGIVVHVRGHVRARPQNAQYLQAKRDRTGHLLDPEPAGLAGPRPIKEIA